MKINFTKKEYRTLLDMVFLAEWVLDAHETQPGKSNSEIHDIAQKIYSCAKDFGHNDLVKYYKDSDEYDISRKYEDETIAFDIIQRYEDQCFWETLIHRLTERDVYNSIGPEKAKTLSRDDFFTLAEPIESEYAGEFESHGLKRIKIGST